VIAVEPLGVEVAAMSVRLSWAAGILIAGLLAVLFAAGWRYYLTPPVRRPFHFQHELLRPSGVIGLSLGVVGTAIIIASLAYSLRKRFVSWSRVGSLRGWLAWHILAGLVGPALIVFHSSFAPSSAVALLAFGAMWVVVASGFAGRFIYVRLPKAVDGRELELEDVRHRVAHYRRTLMDLGVDESLLPTAELPARRREWLWLFRAAGAVLWGDRAARRDFDRIRAAISASGYTGPTWDQALLLARRLCEARQWLARHREMRKLMAAWRFFHGWFVTILLAGILFHVAIAVRYGGLWLLGGRQG
jgi:hypothetical protein